MKLEKIDYLKLNARQKEIYNFQKVAGLLAEYGFNCIKLADDWQGADFLAYHKDKENTLKVQLKSRIGISKRYLKKNIFIVFPIKTSWYLIEHDELVKIVEENTNWLNTNSWKNTGGYDSIAPNKKLITVLSDYKISNT